MSRSRLRSRAAGFTLIELLVAITGGLFVAMAVFLLARNGTRFYQREARVSNATLSGVVGFERLRADLVRAGFLISPNVRRDTRVCAGPIANAAWPAEMARMAGLRITRAGSPPNPTLAMNGLAPDSIVLAGSYSSIEQFPVREVLPGGITLVYLQPASGAMARLGVANLGQVFQIGRGARIVDETGMHHYGTITAVDPNPLQPSVTLGNAPPILARAGGGTCGIAGHGEGTLINVVNIIRYDVRNLNTASNFGGANPAYQSLYQNDPASGAINVGPYDDLRTELVRVELDTSGTPIPGTEELVAEYAVNLEFGITVAPLNAVEPSNPALLQSFGFKNAQIDNWAGSTVTTATPPRGPQLVRAVRTRLQIRSREADRTSGVGASATIAPGLYRIQLAPPAADPRIPVWARVRTLQAEMAMLNQTESNW